MLNILSHLGNGYQNNSGIESHTCSSGKKIQWQFMLEIMWRKGHILPLLVGMNIRSTTLTVCMTVSHSISRSRNSTLWYIPKACKIILNGHLFNSIHDSTICNCQKLKESYIPLDWRMDEENVIQLNNWVIVSETKTMISWNWQVNGWN